MQTEREREHFAAEAEIQSSKLLLLVVSEKLSLQDKFKVNTVARCSHLS